ncbi:hypothetical protein L7F22_031614 [Adiantum nelumboides]|nr:hypothetical protein [Adiantum nelumboides]
MGLFFGSPLPGCIIEIFSEQSEGEEEGELWVGGVLVALGYHNETSIRGGKFTVIMDPNAAYYNVRFFRTGDYVKRLKNGSLLFLGRKDRVVKVNGNKVNLDEIEASLGRHLLSINVQLAIRKEQAQRALLLLM